MLSSAMTLRAPCPPFAVLLMALLSLAAGLVGGRPAAADAGRVTLLRTPNGGLQPQAVVDGAGVLHLIYFQGSPAHGDIFYVHKRLGQDGPFSSPIRVNSHPRSAIAIGTIRGAQLAVGRNNRVFVAWNGSDQAPEGHGGAPMLFTRLDNAGTAFEPERNLISSAGGIDGGGSLAADARGDVYVTWHVSPPGRDEAAGGVSLARSTDDGRTFSPERKISVLPTGQCGCCAMRAFVDHTGALYILYRAAGQNIHRDTTLLVSQNRGRSFQSAVLQRWDLMACPMSSFSLAEGARGVLGAWETAGQVYCARLNGARATPPTAAPGAGSRKYPVVVAGAGGTKLFAWVEGGGWERGGSVAWQVDDAAGAPMGSTGRAAGVPVWSLITAVARPDGSFLLVY